MQLKIETENLKKWQVYTLSLLVYIIITHIMLGIEFDENRAAFYGVLLTVIGGWLFFIGIFNTIEDKWYDHAFKRKY